MKNRQHSRLLTTLVLVAAVSFALASEAFAVGSTPTRGSAGSVKLSKPSAGPMAGEPDTPANGAPPPPLKLAMPRSGAAGMSDWALRVYWSLRVTLLQLPKRFP